MKPNKPTPVEVHIDAANAGRRLDVFLRQLLPTVPLGALMKLLRQGIIRLDGKKAEPSARPAEGATVTLPRHLSAEMPAAQGTDRPRREPRRGADLPAAWIRYEDADLLILDKPAGVASQPGTGHDDSLTDRLVQHLRADDAPPGHRPSIAQRLDVDVSGLVPAGKHTPALRALALAVREGRVEKTYLALVEGSLTPDEGRIDVPLETRREGGRRHATPSAEGKEAISRYRVVGRSGGRLSLVAVQIDTGRMHQIRAHLASLGHPIVGDLRYGAASALAKVLRLQRPFLHAAWLGLAQPMTGAWLDAVSPLPEELAAVLRAVGLAMPGQPPFARRAAGPRSSLPEGP